MATKIPMVKIDSAFNLADIEKERCINRFKRFLDFICGKREFTDRQMEIFEELNFEIYDILPRESIIFYTRHSLRITVQQSLETGKWICI